MNPLNEPSLQTVRVCGSIAKTCGGAIAEKQDDNSRPNEHRQNEVEVLLNTPGTNHYVVSLDMHALI